MPIPLGILAVAGAGGAGASSDFHLLQTTILGSDTQTITFSNLNTFTQYKHLQLRYTARGSFSNNNIAAAIFRVNGDSGSNYSAHFLYAEGGGPAAGGGGSQSLPIGVYTAGNTSSAGIWASGIINILDFSSTSKNKTIRQLAGGISSSRIISFESGAWYSTSAITSITLTTSSWNYLTGSRFSLYGIK